MGFKWKFTIFLSLNHFIKKPTKGLWLVSMYFSESFLFKRLQKTMNWDGKQLNMPLRFHAIGKVINLSWKLYLHKNLVFRNKHNLQALITGPTVTLFMKPHFVVSQEQCLTTIRPSYLSLINTQFRWKRFILLSFVLEWIG